jgi:hypothetical protein
VPVSPTAIVSAALTETGVPQATATPAASPANPQVNVPAGAGATAAPAQIAAAVPPERVPSGNHAWILVLGALGLVLAGVALTIVVLLVRSMRRPLRVSLIDRSKDLEKNK